jgi:hypothetical protein
VLSTTSQPPSLQANPLVACLGPPEEFFSVLTCGCYRTHMLAECSSQRERALITDVPREKLSELVGRFGIGLSRDARQCKALLADVCGDRFRGECTVLVAAVEEGVVGELLSNSIGLPKKVLLDRLSGRLQANRGVSADLARWSVESWAVALGVVAGGNTLATFKMDGLVPLIDVAGADGTISDAQLDRLLLEAKTRGVSEADARAYLSNYVAARGWQLGKAQGPSGRARAKAGPQPPPPPSSPQPQPQPAPAPRPSSAFRWIAATVIGLAAIAVIMVVARMERQPQPPSATAPTPAPTSAPDTAQQQRRADADREQRTYNAARGNLSALRAYVNTCTVCAFEGVAHSEITKLQTAEQDEGAYNAARGNLSALRAYVNTCTVCAFEAAARSEITKHLTGALPSPPISLLPAPSASADEQGLADRTAWERWHSGLSSGDFQRGAYWWSGVRNHQRGPCNGVESGGNSQFIAGCNAAKVFFEREYQYRQLPTDSPQRIQYIAGWNKGTTPVGETTQNTDTDSSANKLNSQELKRLQ